MTLTISPVTVAIAAGSAPHPEQFEWVCGENREAVLELTADAHVIAMTPTGSETEARNSRFELRLLLWADQ